MAYRIKPLGLPVGSVRALVLLCLTARAVLDLAAERELQPWLGVAILLSAAAYFAARAASPKRAADGAAADAVRPPLGLPAGTVRSLFLLALAYGAWLYFKRHDTDLARAHVLWVLIAFGVGVLSRWILRALRKPTDAGARLGDHLLSLVTIVCAGGLVALAVVSPRPDVGSWTEPLLAAICVHYFATR